MNYIKHLNSAFEMFFYNDDMNPTHISLYMAIFHEWNAHRFAREFFVNRRELMKVAKIGSKSTYHRCIVDLNTWNYLTYYPSYNPYKGSKIKMSIIFKSPNSNEVTRIYNTELEQLAEQYHLNSEQALNLYHPTGGQVLVSKTNNNKQLKKINKPKDRQSVIDFFEENNFSIIEAEKFYKHYENKEWITKNGSPIIDWRAIASNWVERSSLVNEKHKISNENDNLKTKKNKNYGEPL